MKSSVTPGWLHRTLTALSGALKRGLLGKSSHDHRKQFTGSDNALAARRGWRRHEPDYLSPEPSDPQAIPERLKAVAFDLDAASLIALRHAAPEWAIEVIKGATADSLCRDWNPGAADLLVVNARGSAAETLGLCRFLAFCTSYSSDARKQNSMTCGVHNGGPEEERADARLLVLVPCGREALVSAAMNAGAYGCLVLPIDAKQVANMLLRARAATKPRAGRATLEPSLESAHHK